MRRWCASLRLVGVLVVCLFVHGQHRFLARGFAEQETLTFAVYWEEARWRIDLFRVLDLSGVALAVPGSLFYRPY